MKKYIILFLLIIAFNSCQRDDICIDAITPHLIIRFYDNTDAESNKSVTDIQINIEGIDGNYIGDDINTTITSSTDSIAIPLRTDQDFTNYILTNNSLNEDTKNSDTLTVTYNRQSIFVGRSCGYKDIFNNVNYTLSAKDTAYWIKGIEIVTQNIENETQAHVKIYH